MDHILDIRKQDLGEHLSEVMRRKITTNKDSITSLEDSNDKRSRYTPASQFDMTPFQHLFGKYQNQFKKRSQLK